MKMYIVSDISAISIQYEDSQENHFKYIPADIETKQIVPDKFFF